MVWVVPKTGVGLDLCPKNPEPRPLGKLPCPPSATVLRHTCQGSALLGEFSPTTAAWIGRTLYQVGAAHPAARHKSVGILVPAACVIPMYWTRVFAGSPVEMQNIGHHCHIT